MRKIGIISAIIAAAAITTGSIAFAADAAVTQGTTTQPSGPVYVCVGNSNSSQSYYEFRAPIPHSCIANYSLWKLPSGVRPGVPNLSNGFTYTAEDGTTFICKLDFTYTAAAGSSPASLAPGNDGSYLTCTPVSS